MISSKDKQIIRDLAKTQLEYANLPYMQELKKEWTRHNDGILGRPMVTVEWGTFSQEAIDPLLQTKGKIAREIEKIILGSFLGQKLFKDDSVVNNFVGIQKLSSFKPFGLKVLVDHLDNSVGHHFVEQIKDLEEDFDKLKKSKYSIYSIIDLPIKKYVESIVGDILPVKYIGKSLYSVPTQDVVHIMGLENMMFSMYDYPELFHKMMQMLSNDYIEYFKHLEAKGFLLPTNAGEWVGQGTYAFSSTMKGEKDFKNEKVKTEDIWGFMDSQETSSISPAMYEEFIFPYYEKISKIFGALSYGCCEAVDPIWENCLSKLHNLKKVSISPWCNEEKMGEYLKNTGIVYHRKPSPNYLGVDKVFDKEGFTKHIQKTISATKDCVVEFTQRDVYTVHNDMQKVKDYVSIIRKLTT